MSKLRALRSRLAGLRRRRASLRIATAVSAIALAVLWSLIVLFLADWVTEMDVLLRVVLLLAGAGAVAWAFRRYSLPLLQEQESELDMALLVERQAGITAESDLVAALQFESPEATDWGSPQLEDAVIDYVADHSQDIDVYQGMTAKPLFRRLGLLGVTVVVIGLFGMRYADHLLTFANRLLLQPDHYPTQTTIERILINEQVVYSAGSGNFRPQAIEFPYGKPVSFKVEASGALPLQGLAVARTPHSGAETRLELTPAGQGSSTFTAGLERLVDPLQYEIYLGDAWTEQSWLNVIPLPAIEVHLKPTPPKYAAGRENKEGEVPAGAMQIAVIEGSQVGVEITATKPLKQARLTVEGADYPLVKSSDDRRKWQLPVKDTPLEKVSTPVRFEITVVDEDDLALEQPREGFIRIKPDRRPRVTAGVITTHVLPQGKPSVAFGARDDYGISTVRVHKQVIRRQGEMSEQTVEIPLELDGDKRPEIVQERYAISLDALNLQKGDQVKIVLEAIDYRGESQGQSAFSDPLILNVTDVSGVLAAMSETDERSARQLDAIIRRQLGIGETR